MNNLNRFIVRSLTCATIAALTAAGASAKPARRGIINAEQPDGSTVAVRLYGNAFTRSAFTEDGFPLLSDDNLGYVYADIAANGELIPSGLRATDKAHRSEKEIAFLKTITPEKIQRINTAVESANRAKAPMRGPGLFDYSYPTKGEQKALVILVQYPDVKFGSKNTSFNYSSYGDGTVLGYWQDELNQEGFSGCGCYGSCRDWFLDNSRNAEGESQFLPEFDVFGPVTLPNNMSYYGGSNDRYAHKMVLDACELLDDEIDFTQYDRDGDGIVDNIYLYYAGFGEADGGPTSSVWPHSYEISSCETKIYRYDGVVIDRYACSNETDYLARRPDGIGTFVHEFSHVMGLPDLYSTVYNNAYTPGEYSVLDYGPYNNDGKTPPNYSAFERYALDWLTPKQFEETRTYELLPIDDTNEAYIVNTEKANEYFLVESRKQQGWDSFIPGHGMLIWHIDFVKSVWDNNTVNNTSSHQYVDLIEANNVKSESQAAGHPFPGTRNVTSYKFKSWSNRDTGVSFTDIAEDPTTGNISMTAENTKYVPQETGVNNIQSDDTTPEYYNMQGIRVTNPAKGDILIRKSAAGTVKIRF